MLFSFKADMILAKPFSEVISFFYWFIKFTVLQLTDLLNLFLKITENNF